MRQYAPTQAMQRCLVAIRKLTVEGVPPSYEELRIELGLANRSGVHDLLHLMKERGLIDFGESRHRSLFILPQAEPLEHLTTDELGALRARIDAVIEARAS